MDEIRGKESYNEVIFLLEMENSKMDLKQILKLVWKFLNGFSPAIQGPLFLFIFLDAIRSVKAFITCARFQNPFC